MGFYNLLLGSGGTGGEANGSRDLVLTLGRGDYDLWSRVGAAAHGESGEGLGSVVFSATVIPEPSAAAMLMAGLAGLASRRRLLRG